MIGEIAVVLNNAPEIADPALWAHKKAVAKTVLKAVPESVKGTADSIREHYRKRAIGAAALAAATAGQVYGDDIVFYSIYSGTKDAITAGTPAKVATAWAVTSIAAATGQGVLARLNQKHARPDLEVPVSTIEQEPIDTDSSFGDRLRKRGSRIRKHAGKLAITLTTLGVGGHVWVDKFSKKEIAGHAAAWGLTAPVFYEAANISLGALDNPLAPIIVGTAIAGSRYVNEVCERAAGSFRTEPSEDLMFIEPMNDTEVAPTLR